MNIIFARKRHKPRVFSIDFPCSHVLIDEWNSFIYYDLFKMKDFILLFALLCAYIQKLWFIRKLNRDVLLILIFGVFIHSILVFVRALVRLDFCSCCPQNCCLFSPVLIKVIYYKHMLRWHWTIFKNFWAKV